MLGINFFLTCTNKVYKYSFVLEFANEYEIDGLVVQVVFIVKALFTNYIKLKSQPKHLNNKKAVAKISKVYRLVKSKWSSFLLSLKFLAVIMSHVPAKRS